MINQRFTEKLGLIGAASALLTATAAISPAQAAILNYELSSKVTIGSDVVDLNGSFSIDDSTISGSGFEFVSPGNGLLDLNVNFRGESYDIGDEFNQSLSTVPAVGFQDGRLLGLDFEVNIGKLDPNEANDDYLMFSLDQSGKSVAFVLEEPAEETTFGDGPEVIEGQGDVNYRLVEIPEPSLVIGLGLLGLGAFARRKRENPVETSNAKV